jgi:hypothetical protein
MLMSIMSPAFHRTTLLLCAAALGACASPGRNFLTTRTSIDVQDGPICGAAVIDNDTCRPGNFGGGKWVKDSDFPPFTISEYGFRGGTPQRVAAEVRAHYLGSPYYDGDVHSYCKMNIDTDLFPGDTTSLQEYDLSKMIEDRAVRPLTTRLHSGLQMRDAYEANGITARFYERIMEEVHERVQARYIWFVTRYPGGIPDMARNERLRRCLQEARDHDADIVSGVAGYIVLDNRIDNSVSSRDVMYRALDRATAGYDDFVLDGGLRHELGREWEERVAQIANIKMARQDLTSTAWPLWVQLQ